MEHENLVNITLDEDKLAAKFKDVRMAIIRGESTAELLALLVTVEAFIEDNIVR